MNNSQEKEELEHKYLCLTMNKSISNNAQELSKKEKKSAYNKEYYIANKQRLAAQHQAYREKHEDKVKEYYKKYSKAYYEFNKEKAIAQNQTWAENNREKTRAYDKAWRERNKQIRTKADIEKKKAYNKAYQEANREKIKEYNKSWYKNNPGRSYSSRKQRHEKTPLNKVKDLLRGACYRAFARIKHNKPANTLSLLGCTWEEAKTHFEYLFQEGMSWENHGEWHIDHIRPVASFAQDELHLMNHISNLQPLWAKDNIQKKDYFF